MCFLFDFSSRSSPYNFSSFTIVPRSTHSQAVTFSLHYLLNTQRIHLFHRKVDLCDKILLFLLLSKRSTIQIISFHSLLTTSIDLSLVRKEAPLFKFLLPNISWISWIRQLSQLKNNFIAYCTVNCELQFLQKLLLSTVPPYQHHHTQLALPWCFDHGSADLLSSPVVLGSYLLVQATFRF